MITKYPAEFYFTKEHGCIPIEENTAYISLTELAKKEIKEIKSIEVHTLGILLSKQQVFGRIMTIRFLRKLTMPFKGTELEINHAYCNNIEYINSAYGENYWIVKVNLAYLLI